MTDAIGHDDPARRPDPPRCTHWIGPERRYCGATPTRFYAYGYRCAEHNKIGRPGQGGAS
ncbi:hypothetical protein GCM10009799_47520 [Nocardiopsis rhodophaea]|uniref:GcrA cell cycle regulator n=1 Tax=Nocardiopsis rhodophaea TaxID=280238 RepID=A0ABN2TLN6_9ACTN